MLEGIRKTFPPAGPAPSVTSSASTPISQRGKASRLDSLSAALFTRTGGTGHARAGRGPRADRGARDGPLARGDACRRHTGTRQDAHAAGDVRDDPARAPAGRALRQL